MDKKKEKVTCEEVTSENKVCSDCGMAFTEKHNFRGKCGKQLKVNPTIIDYRFCNQ